MTNWFCSTSLKNTSWPVSGHLIQRFSGDSRRLRKLRIFGRTTLEIQFIGLSCLSAVYISLRTAAVTVRRSGFFRSAFLGAFLGRAHAAGQLGNKLGHG